MPYQPITQIPGIRCPSGKVKEISLNEGFGEVAVKVNGVRVEVHQDGSVAIEAEGDVVVNGAGVKVRDDGSVFVDLSGLSRAAQEGARANRNAPPHIGDTMPDGTIYAGISPNTGSALYTTPKDAPLTMKWKQAMDYAAKFAGHGHNDWRLPTREELNVLFNNCAAIGGFINAGLRPTAGWYWSCGEHPDDPRYASVERFNSGVRGWSFKGSEVSVRCVRSEP